MILDTLQRPLRDLRISVTDRCNFRCTYCMPEEEGPYKFMSRKKYLSFEEILKVVRVGSDIGVRKVRLTGGEPLLRPKLEQLIEGITSIEGVEDLALTTNGSLLKSKVDSLWSAGLRRLTVSLDGINNDLVTKISGSRFPVNDVLQGVIAARQAGFSVKMNSVVMRGVNESEILPLTDFAMEHGVNIRFIEYMDVGGATDWGIEKSIRSEEIAGYLSSKYELKALSAQYKGEVATRWSLLSHGESMGEVGFISSVSKPFCGDCNRIRLSADGALFKCLFATVGQDIKPHLENEEQLRTFMSELWGERDDRYSELRHVKKEGDVEPKVPMSFIGG